MNKYRKYADEVAKLVEIDISAMNSEEMEDFSIKLDEAKTNMINMMEDDKYAGELENVFQDVLSKQEELDILLLHGQDFIIM